MASIPSPIRKWIRRYITGEGSNEIANQSPVQSVNSQTGDVTISTGGGSIPPSQTVTSYSDLPTTDLSEAEIWLVAGEEDVVVSTQLSPVVWRSVSDFTKVASQIPDSVVTRTADNNVVSNTGQYGHRFESTVEWPSIGAEISANCVGQTRAYLYDVDDGNALIEDKDISGLSAGDSFTFDGVNLSPNTTYSILLDADGVEWDAGYYDSANFAYTSADSKLTIKSADFNGSSFTDNAYSFSAIGDVGFS